MKVLLLAGGESSESRVSLVSGRSVYEALNRLGHTVIPLDPATGKTLLEENGRYIEVDHSIVAENDQVSLEAITKNLPAQLEQSDFRDAEVVFLALHGGAGENGTIQNLLDLAGMNYTGSGMAASVLAMDKAKTKQLMKAEDIATPDWAMYELTSEAETNRVCKEILDQFEFPCIVKPNNSGSTVGLTKVENADQLPGAIASARVESPEVLVEEYVAGRELTVAVLDGRTFPVVEIIPENGLYDYKAKYTKGGSDYVCPAQIDVAVSEEAMKAAVRVYRVIGAAGLARVDFIMNESSRLFCLEINTLPGMTELSLAPMAAKAAGVNFDELIELMLLSARGK
jgi:D-alanine-D-alanine ligase